MLDIAELDLGSAGAVVDAGHDIEDEVDNGHDPVYGDNVSQVGRGEGKDRGEKKTHQIIAPTAAHPAHAAPN